jgi:hypothetical protein
MELVAFKKAVGIEGEAFTSKATFFEGYSWKDLRCSGCNRHVGYACPIPSLGALMTDVSHPAA